MPRSYFEFSTQNVKKNKTRPTHVHIYKQPTANCQKNSKLELEICQLKLFIECEILSTRCLKQIVCLKLDQINAGKSAQNQLLLQSK